MAKTGGTTVNLMLAGRFKRVRGHKHGHKGYSYDWYQSNAQAARQHANKPEALKSIGFSSPRVSAARGFQTP